MASLARRLPLRAECCTHTHTHTHNSLSLSLFLSQPIRAIGSPVAAAPGFPSSQVGFAGFAGSLRWFAHCNPSPVLSVCLSVCPLLQPLAQSINCVVARLPSPRLSYPHRPHRSPVSELSPLARVSQVLVLGRGARRAVVVRVRQSCRRCNSSQQTAPRPPGRFHSFLILFFLSIRGNPIPARQR